MQRHRHEQNGNYKAKEAASPGREGSNHGNDLEALKIHHSTFNCCTPFFFYGWCSRTMNVCVCAVCVLLVFSFTLRISHNTAG